MPLSIPSRKGVSDALQGYIRDAIPHLDPSTLRRSIIGGAVKSIASGLADWYIALKRYADNEPFPQRASESFLTTGWWVALTHLTRNPAVGANGLIAFTGTSGAVVPAGTELSASSVTYTTSAAVSVANQSFIAASLTSDAIAGVAIFKTANPHNLATGLTVTITGASNSAYNGTYQITVTDVSTFTYEPLTVPPSASTGTPIASATFAAVEVRANTAGRTTNLSPGTTLNFTGTVTDVGSLAFVTAGGVSGGSDIESVEEYRARILKALGTDFGMFTADEIEIVAKQVPGVTRVMVRKASLNGTNGVLEGQVKVAFLRDDDVNPLPSAQDVANVRAKLLELELPAHMAPEDLIVMSPPPYTVNFQFGSITPDTPGLRLAIAASLKQYFREQAVWGQTIATDDYRCAIKAAYDIATRQHLKSFTLITPTADIVPGVDAMPVLGTVQF